MTFRFRFLLVGLCLCSTTVFAARSSFDEAWRFVAGNPAGAETTAFDDTAWRVLDVPHDWSVEGAFDPKNPSGDRGGYLPTGIGWYRKTIEVPAEWRGRRVAIEFDGVYMNSKVWANRRLLGSRPYGWISLAYDISDIVEHADQIAFAVQLVNELQPSARWYSGSGICGPRGSMCVMQSTCRFPESGCARRATLC